MIAQLDRKISRRCFIRQVGAVGTISAITPTMLFTQCSISNSMSWQNWPSDTQEAFVEAVAWLVEHTLDRLFPNFGKGIDAALKLAKELAVKKVSPKPTPDDFHNSHSSRYVVTNEKYQFDAQRSTKFNCYIKLDEYARAGDLNMLLDLSTAEIMRLRYELEPYDRILFPTSERIKDQPTDYIGFSQTSENKYKTSPRLLNLEYVRDFSDGTKKYKAYGVKSRRTGQSDLLISV